VRLLSERGRQAAAHLKEWLSLCAPTCLNVSSLVWADFLFVGVFVSFQRVNIVKRKPLGLERPFEKHVRADGAQVVRSNSFKPNGYESRET